MIFAQASDLPVKEGASRLLEYGILGVFVLIFMAVIVVVSRVAWSAKGEQISAFKKVVPLIEKVSIWFQATVAKLEDLVRTINSDENKILAKVEDIKGSETRQEQIFKDGLERIEKGFERLTEAMHKHTQAVDRLTNKLDP